MAFLTTFPRPLTPAILFLQPDERGLDSPRKLSSLPRTTEIIIESTLDQDLADKDV